MLSSANYTQYKELQSFQSVEEMNEAICSFIQTYT